MTLPKTSINTLATCLSAGRNCLGFSVLASTMTYLLGDPANTLEPTGYITAYFAFKPGKNSGISSSLFLLVVLVLVLCLGLYMDVSPVRIQSKTTFGIFVNKYSSFSLFDDKAAPVPFLSGTVCPITFLIPINSPLFSNSKHST